jgi:hypothetical protein
VSFLHYNDKRYSTVSYTFFNDSKVHRIWAEKVYKELVRSFFSLLFKDLLIVSSIYSSRVLESNLHILVHLTHTT